MGGLSPEAVLIAVLIALGVWAGEGIVHGVKVGVHKAKCGIERVVGKHCEPPKEADPNE